MKEIYNLLEPQKYSVLELRDWKGVHLNFEQCVLITQKLVDMELELKKLSIGAVIKSVCECGSTKFNITVKDKPFCFLCGKDARQTVL